MSAKGVSVEPATPAPTTRRRPLAASPIDLQPSRHTYYLYGLRLQSDWVLPYSIRSAVALADVRLVRGSPAQFVDPRRAAKAESRAGQAVRLRAVPLADGRTYLSWEGRFEFLVSAEGRVITARALGRGSLEVFHTYLLGQALSFALVRQGFDPLHATVVIVDGAGVAFLGDSGYGKSTLSAAFVQAGHRLLTDDLLVLSGPAGSLVAHPGPPRIKLFPTIARTVLASRGPGVPISGKTGKLLIPLEESSMMGSAVPLKAVYVLAPPVPPWRERRRIRITRLTKRRACVELLRSAFNTTITDPPRLSRQFSIASQLAGAVPINLLGYPRTACRLSAVQQAILDDLSR